MGWDKWDGINRIGQIGQDRGINGRDQAQTPLVLVVPVGHWLRQASLVLREVGQLMQQIWLRRQVLTGQERMHCDPTEQVPMGQLSMHCLLYWNWLELQVVEGTQTPPLISKPVPQMMQKLELKQLRQLEEQGRHCLEVESGQKPLRQEPTQAPLLMNWLELQVGPLATCPWRTHPPKALGAQPVKQPPQMQMPSQKLKPESQMLEQAPLMQSCPYEHWACETQRREEVSIKKPEMHLVQVLMVLEHSAQLALQGWQLPPMEVKPEPQEVTHWPMETMPEEQVQTPLTGFAPAGQEVWQAFWKQQKPLRQEVQAPEPSQVAQGQGQVEQTPPRGVMAELAQVVQKLKLEQVPHPEPQLMHLCCWLSKNWWLRHPFWQMLPVLTQPMAQLRQFWGVNWQPQQLTAQATQMPWKLNWFSPQVTEQVPLVETEPCRQLVQLLGPPEQVVHWIEQGAHLVADSLQKASGQLSSQLALMPTDYIWMAGHTAQQLPLQRIWLPGQLMQLIEEPRQVSQRKSQTRQTPSLMKVPATQLSTQLCMLAEVWRQPMPLRQLVQQEGWLMQVLQGSLQGTQFQLPEALSPIVPAGQTQQQLPLYVQNPSLQQQQIRFSVHRWQPVEQVTQTEPKGVEPSLQLARQTVPCRRRGTMQELHWVAEEQFWQPFGQGRQVLAGLTQFLTAQMHFQSTVMAQEVAQVMQVIASRQETQLEPQGEQYLTPSGETVKQVVRGQLQEPSPAGVARATQLVQLVADMQMPQPLAQGTQVLLESGQQPSMQTQMLSGSLITLFLEVRHWMHSFRPCSQTEQKGSALQFDCTHEPSAVEQKPGRHRQVWRPELSVPATRFLPESQAVQRAGEVVQVRHSGLHFSQVRVRLVWQSSQYPRMQVQREPVRFLNLVASQLVQPVALVQVRQVWEQVEQLTAPASKKPVMHLQFWVISRRVESTQAVQTASGEEQFWHCDGHFWHCVPLMKKPLPQVQLKVTLLRLAPTTQVVHLLGVAGLQMAQQRAEQGQHWKVLVASRQKPEMQAQEPLLGLQTSPAWVLQQMQVGGLAQTSRPVLVGQPVTQQPVEGSQALAEVYILRQVQSWMFWSVARTKLMVMTALAVAELELSPRKMPTIRVLPGVADKWRMEQMTKPFTASWMLKVVPVFMLPAVLPTASTLSKKPNSNLRGAPTVRPMKGTWASYRMVSQLPFIAPKQLKLKVSPVIVGTVICDAWLSSRMNCSLLWVGTVKKLFWPTASIWVQMGVMPSLQRKSTFLVKMSATKKTSRRVLGLVMVKVSIELRVAFIEIVEQVTVALLGKLNLVMPQMAQRVSGRWQQRLLGAAMPVPRVMATPELKVVTAVQMQLAEQSISEPEGQVFRVITRESYRDNTKATLMYSRADVGLQNSTLGPWRLTTVAAPKLTTTVFSSVQSAEMAFNTPALRQLVVLAAVFHMKPMMQA